MSGANTLTSLNITRVLADTIVSMTQDISQGIQASQIVSLNCHNTRDPKLPNQPSFQERCAQCVEFWTSRERAAGVTKPDQAEISQTCKYVCSCRIQDVNLRQVVAVNFRSLQETNRQQEFFATFIDNLVLEASAEGVHGLPDPAKIDAVQKKVNEVYELLVSDTVQQSLQSLEAVQVLRLRGPGLISAVDMNQMINMVSTVLQSITFVTEASAFISQQLINNTELKAGWEQIILLVLIIISCVILSVVIFFNINTWMAFFSAVTSA